jgi:hypothetical protein
MNSIPNRRLIAAAITVLFLTGALPAVHAGGSSEPGPRPDPVTYQTESRSFTLPQHRQSVTVWADHSSGARRNVGSFAVQWKVTGTVVAKKASNESTWRFDRMLHSQWHRSWENYEKGNNMNGSVLTVSGQKHVNAQLYVYGQINVSVEGVGWELVLFHDYPNVAISGSDESVGTQAVAILW